MKRCTCCGEDRAPGEFRRWGAFTMLVPRGAEPWRAGAACRGWDTAVFFPETTGSGPGAAERGAAARRVCAGCPVRGACLEAGLAEFGGIWGGLDELERRRVRRRRGAG